MMGRRLAAGLSLLLLFLFLGAVSASDGRAGSEPPPLTGNAQDDPLQLLSYLAGGESNAVAIEGPYALLGMDRQLQLLDISHPAAPAPVATLAGPINEVGEDGVEEIAILDEIAYVAQGDLWIVDISDPASPASLAVLETPGQSVAVAATSSAAATVGDNRYVYVADRLGGLRVIDVTNPANPAEVGSLDAVDEARDVAVAGDVAYLIDDGLRLVNVADPASPYEAGHFATQDGARRVAFADSGVTHYAYVSTLSKLVIVDVSDPADPQQVATFTRPGQYPSDVVISGDVAYVVFFPLPFNYGVGLAVVDISEPAAPTELGYYATDYSPAELALSGAIQSEAGQGGATLFVADRRENLHVIDVSDPAQFEEAGFFLGTGWPRGVATADGYAYVAASHYGLRVVDVSDPEHAQTVGSTSNVSASNYAPHSIALSGDYAFVAENQAGFGVYDVSDPTNPERVAVDDHGSPQGVAVLEAYAYVAGTLNDLVIYDISEPANPVWVARHDTPGTPYGVAVESRMGKTYAYVADGSSGGLLIVDVTDPTSPSTVGQYDTPGAALGVALATIDGVPYALVADALEGLRIVDVSDVSNPMEIGTYPTTDYARDVAVRSLPGRTVAFLAAGDQGLLVLDVSGPAAPVEVASYTVPAIGAQGVAVDGELVYLATISGLYTFESWRGNLSMLPLIMR